MPRTDHVTSNPTGKRDKAGKIERRPGLESGDAKRRVKRMLAEIHRCYRNNYDDHFHYAYGRVKSVEVAQDIVQQAFTNALAAAERGARIDNTRGFLNRCVHNLCVSYTHREKKPLPLDMEVLDFIDMATLDYSTASSAEFRDSWHQVEDVIDKLAPGQRYAFILAEIRGLGYEDIARLMNRSVDSVRQLLARARHKVRTRIDVGSDLAVLPIPLLKSNGIPVLNTQGDHDRPLNLIKDWFLQTQARVNKLIHQGLDSLVEPTTALVTGAVVISLAVAPGGSVRGSEGLKSEPSSTHQSVLLPKGLGSGPAIKKQNAYRPDANSKPTSVDLDDSSRQAEDGNPKFTDDPRSRRGRQRVGLSSKRGRHTANVTNVSVNNEVSPDNSVRNSASAPPNSVTPPNDAQPPNSVSPPSNPPGVNIISAPTSQGNGPGIPGNAVAAPREKQVADLIQDSGENSAEKPSGNSGNDPEKNHLGTGQKNKVQEAAKTRRKAILLRSQRRTANGATSRP